MAKKKLAGFSIENTKAADAFMKGAPAPVAAAVLNPAQAPAPVAPAAPAAPAAPEAQPAPAVNGKPSRLSVNVPEKLFTQFKSLAIRKEVSMSAIVVDRIVRRLEAAAAGKPIDTDRLLKRKIMDDSDIQEARLSVDVPKPVYTAFRKLSVDTGASLTAMVIDDMLDVLEEATKEV